MRTWRLISLLSILALVLAACGTQGSSRVGRGVGSSYFWIGSAFGGRSRRADGRRHAGLRRRSTVLEP